MIFYKFIDGMKSPPKLILTYIVKRVIVKCHIIITHLQPRKESPEMPNTLLSWNQGSCGKELRTATAKFNYLFFYS